MDFAPPTNWNTYEKLSTTTPVDVINIDLGQRNSWQHTSKHVDKDVLRTRQARMKQSQQGTYHAKQVPCDKQGKSPPHAAAV